MNLSLGQELTGRAGARSSGAPPPPAKPARRSGAKDSTVSKVYLIGSSMVFRMCIIYIIIYIHIYDTHRGTYPIISTCVLIAADMSNSCDYPGGKSIELSWLDLGMGTIRWYNGRRRR